MPKVIYYIAFSIFIMSTGGYMAMPLFPLLASFNGMPLSEVGMMTGVYIFAQKTLPIISGPLGDRMGYPWLAIAGEGIRGLGFVGISMFHAFPIVLLCAACAGAGGGIASPSLSALMMTGASVEERPKRSSLRTTALNAGLLTGPIFAGLILWKGKPHGIFLIAGLFYFVGSMTLFVVTQKTSINIENIKSKNPFSNINLILKNTPFLYLVFFLFFYWFLFSQLFITIPALAGKYTQHIEIIFWVNGVIGLILQFPIGILLSRYYHPSLYLTIGGILFTISFLIFGLIQYIFGILIGIICFSLGECLMLPHLETMIANSSPNDKEFGTYFGFAALSDGLGRPFGSILGPFLLSSLHTYTWILFALIAVLLVFFQALFLNKRIVSPDEKKL